MYGKYTSIQNYMFTKKKVKKILGLLCMGQGSGTLGERGDISHNGEGTCKGIRGSVSIPRLAPSSINHVHAWLYHFSKV